MHCGFISFYSSLLIGWFNKPLFRCFAHWLGLLCLTAIAIGCESAPENKEAHNNELATHGGLQLRSAVNLYDYPNGNQVHALSASDVVFPSGQVSSALFYRRLGQDTLLEPFIEIMHHDSVRYWIYGNPASFQLTEAPQDWQWANRFKALFSPDQIRDYQQLISNWSEPQAGVQLLLVFQTARKLRDELEVALKSYPALPQSQYEEVLPACLGYQREGKSAWWLDFNQWEERAQEWPNAAAEEALFQFYVQEVYPPDGIEYSFPAWHFPVSFTRSHSLLGRGEHYRLLTKLDSLQQHYPFVAREWNLLRTFILDDLTRTEVSYWEDWQAVDQEINQILSSSWQSVPRRLLEEIGQHRKRLQQQASSGDQFDYRNR